MGVKDVFSFQTVFHTQMRTVHFRAYLQDVQLEEHV